MTGFLLALVCLILPTAHAPADDEGWKPVEAAHLALKASTVEKDADAEVIFWEAQVDFTRDRAVLTHYIRIKIFTELGKQSQGSVELPYLNKDVIEQIAGRTIKPDGSIIELKNDAILERTVVKKGKLNLRVKSFILPAVEVGSIIEYRWREVRKDETFLRLYFQRRIPIQLLKYTLRTHADLHFRLFNMKETPFTKEKDNLYSTVLKNVPAFHEEPYMPPEDQVRSWILAFYGPPFIISPEAMKSIYEETMSGMKVDGEVQRAAAAATGAPGTPR